MIDYSTVKKQKDSEEKRFKLVVNFMHGDADLYTDEVIETDDEEYFKNLLEFYFKVYNFLPNAGWAELGYYSALTEHDDIEKIWMEVFKDDEEMSEYFESSEYIPYDKIYGGGDDLCKMEKIKAFVDGREVQLLDMDARQTNLIELPKIGSTIETDMGHINSTGKNDGTICAYTIKDKYGIKFNPDGRKQDVFTPLTGTVVGHVMDDERYQYFDNYYAIIKLDLTEFGVEDEVLSAVEFEGHVENFKQQ